MNARAIEAKRIFRLVSPDKEPDQLTLLADGVVRAIKLAPTGQIREGVAIYNFPYFGGSTKAEILLTDLESSRAFSGDDRVTAIYFETSPENKISPRQMALRVNIEKRWQNIATFNDGEVFKTSGDGIKSSLSFSEREQVKMILEGLTRLAFCAQTIRDRFGRN